MRIIQHKMPLIEHKIPLSIDFIVFMHSHVNLQQSSKKKLFGLLRLGFYWFLHLWPTHFQIMPFFGLIRGWPRELALP